MNEQRETVLREAILKSVKECMDQIDSMNSIVEEVWTPSVDEKYFYIANDGSIGHKIWDNSTLDSKRLFIGNVYKYIDDADFESKRIKLLVDLKKFSTILCPELWFSSLQDL